MQGCQIWSKSELDLHLMRQIWEFKINFNHILVLQVNVHILECNGKGIITQSNNFKLINCLHNPISNVINDKPTNKQRKKLSNEDIKIIKQL